MIAKAMCSPSGSARSKKSSAENPTSAKKEVVYSIVADGLVIGFEILNFLSKRERRPSQRLPVQARILMSRTSGRDGTIDHVRYPCHNAGNYGIMEKDSR